MDALSHVLRVVRLTGAFFIQGRFTAPWSYFSPHSATLAQHLEPGAERVVIFHLITQGDCVVEMAGQPVTPLSAGDVVFFPQGHAHVMASAPGVEPPRASRTIEQILSKRPRLIAHGGGGAPTHLVCGYLVCDSRLCRMLLTGLPPVVKVGMRGTPAGLWLESSMRYALVEAKSPRPGGGGLLAKLAEVLFIEVLRTYMNASGAQRTGWLAGLGDRIVGTVLNAIHARPARDWTLEDLAREAGTSRSVLAERFQQFVGTSPIQYLTQWRMTLAANLLSRSNAPLARIAEDVGYQTDTAFSRAFRREYGVPPAAWRRSHQDDRREFAATAAMGPPRSPCGSARPPAR